MWSAELADYLDAIAVWNRGLRVRIKTAELLRQGGSRTGRARQREMLREARQQLANQMRVQRRRRFRGDVSVELDIFASDEPGTTQRTQECQALCGRPVGHRLRGRQPGVPSVGDSVHGRPSDHAQASCSGVVDPKGRRRSPGGQHGAGAARRLLPPRTGSEGEPV